MQLYFHKEARGNFGDDLNAWFWDEVLSGFRSWDAKTTILGLGTLINQERLHALRSRKLLILGTGVGYGSGAPALPLPPNWDIRGVRGPLSAHLLHLHSSKGITDPAALLPYFPEFQGIAKQQLPVFVPHHRSLERHDWQTASAAIGLSYVSPENDAKQVVRKIAAAPLVLAEAMHAAIIADAFRVPWIPLRIGFCFNAFKWQDWLASLALDCQPLPLYPKIDRLKLRPRLRIALERPWLEQALSKALQNPSYLSDPYILQQKQQRFLHLFEAIKQEYS